MLTTFWPWPWRGATVEDAAAEASVGISTAHRRLKEPGFAARVAALRGEMVGRTVGLLSTVANNAVLTLVKLLSSEGRADTTRRCPQHP